MLFKVVLGVTIATLYYLAFVGFSSASEERETTTGVIGGYLFLLGTGLLVALIQGWEI